jgi:hypothetical protein
MSQHQFEYYANADLDYADQAHLDAQKPLGITIRIARPHKSGYVAISIHAGLSQKELNDIARAIAVLDAGQ